MNIKLMLFIIAFAFLMNAQSQSPCSDQQYLKLKNKPMDSMSQREYEYFMLKEKYCNEAVFPRKDASDPTQLEIIEIEVNNLTKYRGYVPECNVFIDDISNGKPPYSGKISAGKHTVSLFSESKFQAGGRGDKDRMSSAILKLNIEKGKKTKIIFNYKCDTGKNGECDDNEWGFDYNIIKN
jgi:hypothetical protein